MKTNELEIIIKATLAEVFEYTLDPINALEWNFGESVEKINTDQIGLGTAYSNEYRELEVTDYDKNTFFELTNHKNSYQCSYSYKQIDNETTKIVYFEYMENGSELEDPMKQEGFEKLKELLEK